ncbi:MAG: hypothetical protein IJ746_01685 [Ruminococcus sp.]|nr:hypothetical protein [Ruminococcus sp.]
MPSTNQGIFRKILNKYRDLLNDYNDLVSRYESDDISFFDGLAQDSESFYNATNELAFKIVNLLESSDFKMNETRPDYEDIMSECFSMSSKIKSYFNAYVHDIEISGGLSDAERNTISNMTIWDR